MKPHKKLKKVPASPSKPRATPKEFITAWQTSGAVAEVASKLGMTTQQCRMRAWRYRHLGIPLKEYPPVEPPDWDALAVYAAELAASQNSAPALAS